MVFDWIKRIFRRKVRKVFLVSALLASMLKSPTLAQLPPNVEQTLVSTIRQAEISLQRGDLELNDAIKISNLAKDTNLEKEASFFD